MVRQTVGGELVRGIESQPTCVEITYVEGLWSLNVGSLIMVAAYAFACGAYFRVKPTFGCGIVRNGVPHFLRV